jgi:hypothetical protein
MVTREASAGATPWRYWPWHAILLGAYPALFLFAQNLADQVTLEPLWVPLVISVCIAVGLLLLAYALLRNWLRAGLMASALLLTSFAFGHVWNVLSPILAERWLFAILWLAAGGMLILLAWRGGAWVRPLTGILNLVVLALVVFNVVTIGTHVVTARALAPMSGEVPAVSVGSAGRPDVYYIVLDRYAGERTLSRYFDYDNGPFLDALEERGFAVAHDSWANYFKTSLSMFSTLTMDHIRGDEWDDSDPDTFGPIHRAFQARMAVPATFKQLGYEYVHIGNWWEPTSRNADADLIYRFTQNTEFGTSLVSTTLLSLLESETTDERAEEMHGVPLQRAHALYGLDALRNASKRGGPTFTLAHFTLPHPPYAFNPDGSEPTEAQRAERTDNEKYVAQLEYVNNQMLAFIDSVTENLEPGEPDPIILLQTDEGPYPPRFARPEQDNFPWLEATDDEIQWKFAVLTAYRMPGVDMAAQGFTDRTSPVNAFRILFNAYFGANLEILPDLTYLSPDTDHMFDFVEYDRSQMSLPEVPDLPSLP